MYFASLRDRTGIAEEVINTESHDVKELFKYLNDKYTFDLDPEYLRASVNDKYVDFNQKLNDHDTIIFIPPLAGG